MDKLLCLALLVVSTAALTGATICKSDTECGSTECCYIRPQFLVASKRQLVLPQLPTADKTGVCETYKFQGDHCNSIAVMNGHCGCASGLQCRWVPDVTTVAPGGKRSMVYHPEPGSYQCVPK